MVWKKEKRKHALPYVPDRSIKGAVVAQNEIVLTSYLQIYDIVQETNKKQPFHESKEGSNSEELQFEQCISLTKSSLVKVYLNDNQGTLKQPPV